MSKLPLYSFKNEDKDEDPKGKKALSIPDEDPSIDFLNTLVLGQVPTYSLAPSPH